MNIGDGHILSVTKANFTSKPTTTTQSSTDNPNNNNNAGKTNTNPVENEDADIIAANGLTDEEIRTQLPIECEAERYAVLIFWNAFHVDTQDADEVETEYLLACCPFGNVQIIQLLPLFPTTPAPAMSLYSIVVTFEDPIAAKKCQESLQGKELIGKTVNCRLVLPSNFQLPSDTINDSSISTSLVQPVQVEETTVEESIAPMQIEAQLTSEHVQGLSVHHDPETKFSHSIGIENTTTENPTSEEYDPERIQQEVDSVEDFLNSLL